MNQFSCSDSTTEISTPKPATPNPTQEEGNPVWVMKGRKPAGVKEKPELTRRAEKKEEKGAAAGAATDGASSSSLLLAGLELSDTQGL